MSQRFATDEDGNFTVFVLLGFLIMLATAGIGVDIMNFERDRANLQATLDRAVLAAADLDQTLPAKDVVNSYLEKAGLAGKLSDNPGDFVVEEGIGSKRVSAKAKVDVPTHFMSFAGVPSLTANVASAAEEAIGSVEISLVLDMSGSMGRQSATEGKTKIEVLQEAAKTFVTTMINKENADKISMSIIPYATQVNAGADILDKFTNVTSEHDYSHCVNFVGSDFNTAALATSSSLQRTAHFDRYAPRYFPNYSDAWDENRYPTCPVRSGSEITAVTDDVDVLFEQIEALSAQGNTSIDIGMKWGSAMLDPTFRPVVNQLSKQLVAPDSTKTIVPTKFSARPMDYEADVVKVVIVMTDGQNTSQYRLKSSYRSGNSGVWYNADYDDGYGGKGEYSVRLSTSPPLYYWSRQGVYRDHAYGSADWEDGTAARLTYPELFNQVSLAWNAQFNYAWQDNNINTWYYNAYNWVGSSTKDTRTSNACTATKNKGVIVYGIAFEAPEHGLNTIKDCASSASHVYAVNADGALDGGLGREPITLEEAFVSIASSIKRLRLTQ